VVVIVYCVLTIIADRRLRGAARKRSRNILIVTAALIAVRIGVQRVLGIGLVYRLSVMIVGIAAGISALVVAQMLVTQGREGEDEAVVAEEGKERIQSLKLN
jgi:hypothetical protein